jgi:transcriptional regulator with XRE-family HTH domain
MDRKPGFGERLRRLRLDRGLTQQQLAEPDYTAAYVSTIESGRRHPSPATIRHFAKKLAVDEVELVSGIPAELPVRLNLALQEAASVLYRGQYEDAGAQFEAIEAEAATHGLKRLQAKSIEGRALANERRGASEVALGLYKRALEFWSEEPLPLRAEAVAGRARCEQLTGDLSLALYLLDSYRVALEQGKLKDPAALMRTYSSLIWPLSEAALHDRAAWAAAQALKLEPHVPSEDEIAKMHINVARELYRQGRVTDALSSLQRAEDVYRSLNWSAELARAHGSRAMVLAGQGNLAGARAEIQQTMHLLKGTHSVLSKGRALNELGQLERIAGNLPEAFEALSEALQLLDGEVDATELGRTHRELGLCHAADGAAEAAEKHLRSSIILFRRVLNSLELAGAYRLLGDVLCDRGYAESGREAYREGLLSLENSTAA